MAAPDFTTAGLLTQVRAAGFLPDVSDQSDATLLAFADEVVASLISATLRKDREGRLLSYSDTTIVPGTTRYALPRRAMAQTVRGVMVIRPDGTSYAITEADPLVLRQRFAGQTANPDPWWYAFDGDNTIDLGAISAQSGWTLRVYYLPTQPKLITTAEASIVVSTNYGGDPSSVELAASPPSTITTTGALVDIIAGAEPYGPRVTDCVVSSYSNPEVLLTQAVTSYGIADQTLNRQPDYMCPAECTVYPPIPRALWPALVRYTLAKALSALGDPRKADVEVEASGELVQGLRVITQRDDRRSRAMVGDSPLRSGRAAGWRWPR